MAELKKRDPSPEELAADLLGRPFSELDEDEQHVLKRVMSSKIELDHDELVARRMTFGDRVADRVAAIGGSWAFIIFFGLVLIAWMAVNGPLGVRLGLVWDQYPYILLNLVLSTLAALQAPVIMMSQNRQAAKDRISNRHDYEVNLRTTVEILRLHRKVDRLFNKLGQMQEVTEEVAEATEDALNRAGGRKRPGPKADAEPEP
jgi:uncharacterized membrane protein